MSETTSSYGAGRTAETAVSIDRALLRDQLQHVSWGAIFLGLVIAIGFQILLGLLGIAIGFTVLDPASPSGVGAWSIGSSLYVVVVQLVSLFVGAYIAARLSPARGDQSAMMHGASIWALSTIIVFWLGTTTVGMVISGMSGAVSSLGGAVGQAVKAVVPDNLTVNLPELGYDELPEPMKEALRQKGITADNLDQEVRNAYRQVVSPEEQQQIVRRVQQAATGILESPADAPQDIQRAVDDIFGQGGILSEQDVAELQRTLQGRLDLTDEEVRQITGQLQRTAEESRQAVQQALTTAKQQAIQAAEATSSRIGSIAFWTFIASLLGLIAAVAGGKLGEKRDVV